MTFPRKIGLFLILVAAAAAASYEAGLSLPSLRWFYSFGSGVSGGQSGRMTGHLICGILAGIGLLMLALGGSFQWNPLTLRRFGRFRSISRGWISFQILMVLLVLALLDQTLVGKQALAVKYDGRWYFPAFQQKLYPEDGFGGEGGQEADYRKLSERFSAEGKGNMVIMPPVPWDPVLDSDDLQKRTLMVKDDVLHREGEDEPFNGQAVQYWPGTKDTKLRDARFRKGQREGPGSLYDDKGEFAGKQVWRAGQLVESAAEDNGPAAKDQPWIEVVYNPASPYWKGKHFLGTGSNGWDITAQLFGGMQVIFKGAVLYILLTFGIGITIGSLMGYLGGAFDLVTDRFVEILSNIPFLLVVIVISGNIGLDNITLTTIMLIFCAFSWIGVATYLRTATYKEKARDYVAAARVQGAGTARVIFRHILPNAISTIVTLLPFSVAAVASSLTALDFLGFGLPDRYPSWGRILADGTSNLGSPWIVSSVFGMMVGVLLLITFVGEAIREAFDPKKFTTYQ